MHIHCTYGDRYTLYIGIAPSIVAGPFRPAFYWHARELRKKIKRMLYCNMEIKMGAHKRKAMEAAAVTGVSRVIKLILSNARIRPQNNFPVQVHAPISISKHPRLTFFQARGKELYSNNTACGA
jgi:hypothetical protein